MKRIPDRTALFRPSSQVLYNPYMGFTTFQHFRGGPLFSSCVDGWKKEFYPLYGGVEQNGDTEGFHPDAAVAYFRICWRDFEPEENVYNDSLVENLLNQAGQHGQSLLLRLMPHTTRREQDIPDWLARRIPHPERPADARVKDSPEDPLFFIRFSKAVQRLGERFDGHPLLYGVDISLQGAWGEGHNVEFTPQQRLLPLIDAYTHSFSRTPLIGQICSPELIHYARKTRPVGFRADCLGNMNYHMTHFYPKAIAKMADVWRDAPVAFEVCWTIGKKWALTLTISSSNPSNGTSAALTPSPPPAPINGNGRWTIG